MCQDDYISQHSHLIQHWQLSLYFLTCTSLLTLLTPENKFVVSWSAWVWSMNTFSKSLTLSPIANVNYVNNTIQITVSLIYCCCPSTISNSHVEMFGIILVYIMIYIYFNSSERLLPLLSYARVDKGSIPTTHDKSGGKAVTHFFNQWIPRIH